MSQEKPSRFLATRLFADMQYASVKALGGFSLVKVAVQKRVLRPGLRCKYERNRQHMPNSNSVKQKKYLLCLWIWTILLQTTAISRKIFLWYPTLIEVYRGQPFLLLSCRKEFWEDKILIACHTLLLSLSTFFLSWSDCKCYVRTLRNPFKHPAS